MEKLKSKDILAINLKYYRYKNNLSQEKFAEMLGSTLPYINQLENGRRKPTLELLDKFAGKLGITSAELITYNENHNIMAKRIDEKNNIGHLPVILNGVNGAVCNRKALCLPVTAVFRHLTLPFAVPSVSPLSWIPPSWMWCEALVGRYSGSRYSFRICVKTFPPSHIHRCGGQTPEEFGVSAYPYPQFPLPFQ